MICSQLLKTIKPFYSIIDYCMWWRIKHPKKVIKFGCILAVPTTQGMFVNKINVFK